MKCTHFFYTVTASNSDLYDTMQYHCHMHELLASCIFIFGCNPKLHNIMQYYCLVFSVSHAQTTLRILPWLSHIHDAILRRISCNITRILCNITQRCLDYYLVYGTILVSQEQAYIICIVIGSVMFVGLRCHAECRVWTQILWLGRGA